MAQLVSWLAYSGARKSDGTPVASGKVYFYQPDTVSTQVTAYSDEDATVAITQPLTLDAAGRGVAYLKVQARIEVQDSLGNVIRVEDIANTTRAKQVEISQSGYSATDLESLLTTLNTSNGGDNSKYLEAGGTTARNMRDVVGWKVEPQDHAALGDDNNDDTAELQAAINRALTAGKRLFIPPGTYRISSALTVTGGSGKGLVIEGNGKDDVIIKNMSTTGNCLTIDLSSAIDSKIRIKGITFTANTTSSGSAISVVNGDRIVIEDCEFLLHRTAVDVSAVSGAVVRDVVVASTDDNASAMGINLGARGRAINCEVISGTDNGTGIKLTGANARAINCYVSNFATGYNLAGARGLASGCFASSSTTGFSVAAVAGCTLIHCVSTDATTDLSVNASATLFSSSGCTFTTVSSSGALSEFRAPAMYRDAVTSAVQNPTFTPDVSGGKRLFMYRNTYSGTSTPQIAAATGRSNLLIGETISIVIYNGTGNNMTLNNWNSTYKHTDGSTTWTTANSLVTSRAIRYDFWWDGTNFVNFGVYNSDFFF